jgi:SOS response regulatory protein OraA/RecX
MIKGESNMDDILRKLIQQKMNEGIHREAELVGELPSHLSTKLRQLKIESERIDEDLELRKAQYTIDMKRKLQEEFDSRHQQHEKFHMSVWNEIYQTMNIDSNGFYFHQNGNIYTERIADESAPKWKSNDLDFTNPYRS